MDSCKKVGDLLVVGGILCDCYGKTIFAFSHKLEACSVLEVELWGVYRSLAIAWGKGFSKFIVGNDSQMVVEVLEKRIAKDQQVQALINGIIGIGKGGINVEWVKEDKVFNKAADLLAKASHHIRDTFVIYDVPSFLANVTDKDIVGLPGPSCL